MEKELGKNWKSLFAQFDSHPFAAASIGQVHFGKLADGQEVAVKVQYPGVGEGIASDIKNLMGRVNAITRHCFGFLQQTRTTHTRTGDDSDATDGS